MSKSRRYLERLLHERTGIPMAHIKIYGIYHSSHDKETLSVNAHTIVRQGTKISLLVPDNRHKYTVACYREVVIRE